VADKRICLEVRLVLKVWKQIFRHGGFRHLFETK
jgi:hypothetical protein